MIHKTLIIILSVLALGTAFVMAASFTCGLGGILRDVVDTRDTLVVARVHRGGVTFLISTLTLTPFSSQVELFAEDPLVFKAVREYRRSMLLQGTFLNPIFFNGSNATRFGFDIPSWKANPPGPLANGNGYVVFPLWCPLLVFAAYPMFALVRGPLRRRRRRKRNECVHCGYNLTGNVSGVCSECGEEIDQQLAEPL